MPRPAASTASPASATRTSRFVLARGRDVGDRRHVPGAAPSSTSRDGEWLLNPGSVGQPRDGDPRAAWLLLDTRRLDGRLPPHRVRRRRRRRGDPRRAAAGLARRAARARSVACQSLDAFASEGRSPSPRSGCAAALLVACGDRNGLLSGSQAGSLQDALAAVAVGLRRAATRARAAVPRRASPTASTRCRPARSTGG